MPLAEPKDFAEIAGRGVKAEVGGAKVLVGRARRIQRFLSQNMFVAEAFTGQKGSFVTVEDTIASFKLLCEGEYDHLPEQAFFMCGGIEDVEANAKKLAG